MKASSISRVVHTFSTYFINIVQKNVKSSVIEQTVQTIQLVKLTPLYGFAEKFTCQQDFLSRLCCL